MDSCVKYYSLGMQSDEEQLKENIIINIKKRRHKKDLQKTRVTFSSIWPTLSNFRGQIPSFKVILAFFFFPSFGSVLSIF